MGIPPGVEAAGRKRPSRRWPGGRQFVDRGRVTTVAAATSRIPAYPVKPSLARTLLAGAAGGIALNIAMLLTFRLVGFGWDGRGILLDPSVQSPKLIAVWTQMAPLPLVVSRPAPIILGLVLFGVGHAFLYRWLAPGWPAGIAARAWRFAGLVFLLSFLFWEFFTPFNQYGEPFPLIALELAFWAIIAIVDGFAIAAALEWRSEGSG